MGKVKIINEVKPISKEAALPPHLFLLDPFIDLHCGLLMGPKETDYTRPLRVQNITILIPNHLVQLQDPRMGHMWRER